MTRHEYVKNVLEPRFKSEDELYHHGIFGIKWGVRRYQNEDGSLTPEGRKRYLNDSGTELTEVGKKEIAKHAYDIEMNRIKAASQEAVYGGGKYDKEKQDAIRQQKQIAKTIYESLDDKTKKNIKDKEQKYLDAIQSEVEYDKEWENSQEWKEAHREAFKMTYDEIMRNPDFYKDEYSVFNDPKLSDDEKVEKVISYRNFNKTYDAYYNNDVVDKYEAEFSKKHKIPNSDAAWDSYVNTKKKAVENVLGKYGTKKVDKYRTVSDTLKYYLDSDK